METQIMPGSMDFDEHLPSLGAASPEDAKVKEG